MTEDRTNLLVDLDVRVKQVMLLCDKLKQENSRLEDELVMREDEITRIREEMSLLKEKHDNLKMARTITAASVDVDTAKTKLSKLVREVDKCISLLKV